ncbi:MAG: class F sortase [Dehalococcoidia bacterium]
MNTSTRRIGAALAMIVTGVALAAVLLTVGLREAPDAQTDALYAATATAATAARTPPATPPSVLATPDADVATPREPVLLAPPAAIRIERLGVEADLVPLGVDVGSGNMAAPDGPELVGWYDFTAAPGAGTGNAVFAGHRDWRGYGPAVFYDLAELAAGDTVEVILSDGSRVRYEVVTAHTYPVAAIDMRTILARTERETLTLITCAGTIEGGDYSDRHIVRAVRTEVVTAAPERH